MSEVLSHSEQQAVPDDRLLDHTDGAAPGDQEKTVFLLDEGPQSSQTKSLLTDLGYRVMTGGADGLALRKIEYSLVNHHQDPDLKRCAELSRSGRVILQSDRQDFPFKLEAVRNGVSVVVPMALEEDVLLSALTSQSGMSLAEARVLIVNDDELAGQMMALSLEEENLLARTLSDPLQVEDVLRDFRPDLLVMDVDMPRANGFEVAKALRMTKRHLSIPILFLSADGREEIRTRAEEISGDIFLVKPLDPAYFLRVVKFRLARTLELRALMDNDGLTGLRTQVAFKERFASEVKRIERTGSGAALAILDLDHFKRVNDTYGHPFGDHVIRSFAQFLTRSVRSVDVIGRIGGEEFAILFLDTSASKAAVVLETIRSRFCEEVVHYDGQSTAVTVSIGVADTSDADSASGIISLADKALYEAKREGRNQVRVYTQTG